MGGLRHRSDPLLRALSTTVSQRLSRVHQSTNFRRPQFCRCSAGRLFPDSCRAKRTCLGPIARVITTASHSPHPTFTRPSLDLHPTHSHNSGTMMRLGFPSRPSIPCSRSASLELATPVPGRIRVIQASCARALATCRLLPPINGAPPLSYPTPLRSHPRAFAHCADLTSLGG